MNALFINTRPSHKADFDLPIPSTRLPLLNICHIDKLSDHENVWLTEFIQGKIQTVVVVSTEAVKGALAHLKRHGIHHAQDLPHCPTMIAVGKPTKNALAEFGFNIITPNEQALPMSNEGMIQMPKLGCLGDGDTVMIWRGVGGRRALHDDLVKRGVSIKAMVFYERYTPHNLADDMAQLFAKTPTNTQLFVLISSAMSLNGWVANDPRTHQMSFITLGDRLAKLTKRHYPNNNVYQTDKLSNQQIVAILDGVMH